MRPERLNPLFAEADTLEGVGPKFRKPLDKLGLTRIRDLAYHLPDRFVTRRAVENLDEASEGEQIVVALTPIEHRAPRNNRGPYRVLAQDAPGNQDHLVVGLHAEAAPDGLDALRRLGSDFLEHGAELFTLRADVALDIANRGYILQTGEIVLADTSARLRDNDEVRRAYLGV